MTNPPDPGTPTASPVDPSVDGPLDRAHALALLEQGDRLLDSGELVEAARHYSRVIGHEDPAVTAAALLGLGTVYFRADQEEMAVATWRQILQLPETPGTYLAWRQLAAAAVREGDLTEALRAYREAERRAPAADKPEIAARLGWLAKETGDAKGARRYFARSRGGAATATLTYAIIGLTVVVSVLASLPDWSFLFDRLELDKHAVAAGEYWRLFTATLLHLPVFENPLHLLFNMYALYFAGTLVEEIYGWKVMGLMYVLTGIAASTASFVLGPLDIPSVGASGAIFGMFGVLLAASRMHQPVLGRRGQAILGQIGGLILINLVIGFAIPGIDNTAHVGGLLAGIWLGFLLVPGRVATLSSLWQGVAGSGAGPSVLRALGILALVAVIAVGVAMGTARATSTATGSVTAGAGASVGRDAGGGAGSVALLDG